MGRYYGWKMVREPARRVRIGISWWHGNIMGNSIGHFPASNAKHIPSIPPADIVPQSNLQSKSHDGTICKFIPIYIIYIYMCVCKCIIIYTYICVCECVHINIAVGFLSHRIPITSPLYHRFRTLPETSWVEPPPVQWSGPVVLQPTNKPRSVTLDKHVGFHEQPWPVISQNILGKQII